MAQGERRHADSGGTPAGHQCQGVCNEKRDDRSGALRTYGLDLRPTTVVATPGVLPARTSIEDVPAGENATRRQSTISLAPSSVRSPREALPSTPASTPVGYLVDVDDADRGGPARQPDPVTALYGAGRAVENADLVPRLIPAPVRVAAAGEPPKTIDELVGRASDGDEAVSLALMVSPPGWAEPGQRPEFDEYTIVLSGMVRVEHEGGAVEAHAGQAVHCAPGEWVRYSTPGPDGARYVSVCVPAFSFDVVHRDPD